MAHLHFSAKHNEIWQFDTSIQVEAPAVEYLS